MFINCVYIRENFREDLARVTSDSLVNLLSTKYDDVGLVNRRASIRIIMHRTRTTADEYL